MRHSLLLVLLSLFAWSPLAAPNSAVPISAFDQYGAISWQDEKARLDNFAIQLWNEPDSIGYFLIRVGQTSCRNEAQNHAVRAKNYLMNVRHIPWNRIVWQDVGFGDEFQVTIWLVPRGKNVSFDYDRATDKHVVRNCKRRALNSDAPNKSLDRSGGGVFRIKRGTAKVE